MQWCKKQEPSQLQIQWRALSTVQKMSKRSKAVAQNTPKSMEQPQDQWAVDVC